MSYNNESYVLLFFLTPRRRPVPVPRQRKVQKPDDELAATSRQQPITIQPSSPYPNLSSKSLSMFSSVFFFYIDYYFTCRTWGIF